MNVNASFLIGLIGVISSFIFAFLGYNRGQKKERDDKENECKKQGREDGELKADTEYIKKRIDDVLLEQRNINKTVSDHAIRIALVEAATKSAHHRLDEIKKEGLI